MKRLLAIISLLIVSKIGAQGWKTDDQYIQNFAKYAVEEMEKYKIPASITLAQGLLETGGGQSRLAQEGKNHFGIKCKEDWTGKTMAHTDDAPNECFRVYDDPKQSYEDHSKFLAERKYYVNLFKLDPKDYKAWAHGLKKAGYATNPKYAYILLSKIEKYKLYEFDNSTSKDVEQTLLRLYPELSSDSEFLAKWKQVEQKEVMPARNTNVSKQSIAQVLEEQKAPKIKSKAEILAEIIIRNHPNGGMKYFVMPEEMEVSLIAHRFSISEERLKRYNDLKSDFIRKNQIVFIEPKSTEGNVESHKVQMGETMHDISQKFGIKLYKLYAKNGLHEGKEPKIGDVIYLQDRKPKN